MTKIACVHDHQEIEEKTWVQKNGDQKLRSGDQNFWISRQLAP